MPELKRILAVDDTEAGRYALVRILKLAGYTVTEAGSGAETLRLAQAAESPDLIILDVNLPDFNGFEVCRRLKSNPATAGIPVLHLSSTFATSKDRAEGLQGGADAYLAAPVEPQELLATVQALLRVREAEDAARAASAQWEKTFNSIRDAICLLDSNGALVRCNDAMAELLRVPLSQARGRLLEQVLAEALGVQGVPPLAELQGARRRETREWQANDRWWRFSVDPIGECPHAVAVLIISDITEQKRAEAEIRKLNRDLEMRIADFQAMLRVIPIGIAVAEDPDCRHVSFNPSFTQVLGLAPGADASLGAAEHERPPFKFCRDGRELRREELPLYMAAHGHPMAGTELDLVHPDGNVHTLYGSAAPLYDSAGNIRGSVGGFVDISARKQAQEALRQSERRFRRLVEANPAGVVVANLERILDANDAFLRMVGYSREELAGGVLSWRALTPPEYRPSHEAGWRELMETGQCAPLEKEYLRKDGSRIPILIGAALLEREPLQVVCFVLDLSERKQTQEVLRLNEKLAATGRLAASIAHEINNPMASVTNLLYLLDSTPQLPAPAKEYVTIARREVARMAHIVKQMLGFYRESATPVAVRPSEIIDSVLDLHRAKMQAHGIRVVKCIEFDGEIEGFPGELRQVFVNLVSNSIEAMGSGGLVKIHIAEARDWQNPAHHGVRVVVADNGPGISADHRAQIFEPFFTTKGIRGTGLGLWVTDGIVRKHGGRIRVRSSTRTGASGTTFAVFLPSGRNRQQPYIVPAT